MADAVAVPTVQTENAIHEGNTSETTPAVTNESAPADVSDAMMGETAPAAINGTVMRETAPAIINETTRANTNNSARQDPQAHLVREGDRLFPARASIATPSNRQVSQQRAEADHQQQVATNDMTILDADSFMDNQAELLKLLKQTRSEQAIILEVVLALKEKLSSPDEKLDSLDTKLNSLDVKLSSINEKLSSLDVKMEMFAAIFEEQNNRHLMDMNAMRQDINVLRDVLFAQGRLQFY